MKKHIQVFTFLMMLCTLAIISTIYVRAEQTGETNPPITVMFQEAIPDVNFRKFINDNIFTQKLNDTDIFNESYKDELKDHPGTLNLSKQKVSDLTGIAYFENISELIAQNNSIQKLNLEGLLHLESIQVARNNLSQITLTNLPALKDLDVSYNSLSSLEIQSLTSLENLNCANNEIGLLDVSKNVHLDTLIVENNNLVTLDISKLSVLKWFLGGGNKFLSFDISAFPNIMHFELFELRKSSTSMNANTIGVQYGITLPENATEPISNTISDKGLYLAGTRSIIWTSLTDIPPMCTYQYTVKGSDEVVNVTIIIDKTALLKEVLTVGKPLNFKATNSTYDKITLSWALVNGSDGYRIYRSTSEKGTYSLIKTISSGATSSYKNSYLATGSTYYYKIRAFRSIGTVKYFGAYSGVIYKKVVPQKSTVSLSKYSTRKIKVSWKKINGISGYYIYRSTSKDGTYKKIKTITSKTATSYIDTKRVKGVTYYYRMRAYCKVNGKYVYGIYSAKKSKKL